MIDYPRAAGRLKGKVDPWYAEGVTAVCGIGADESDRDEVAMDVVCNNSPVYRSSTDVEIPRNGAHAISLQPKFMRRYTGLIALHEVLHRGSWMVGIAIVYFELKL